MSLSFHTLKISDIKKETEDTVSISFEIPTEIKESFKFDAGQYLTLKTNINGEELRRSYSISSAPFENECRVAIKQVVNGKFSTYANEFLKKEDEIEVMSPKGSFKYVPNSSQSKNYILFAAGSGITPVISILKSILKNESKSNVILFYGNKNFGSIIFREELEALKNEYMENFRLVHILSRESLGNPLQKGRIDFEKCENLKKAFLMFEKDEIESCEVYVCGPEEMIFAVKESMLTFGIPAKQIHFELFGTTIPKKEKIEVLKTDKIHANVRVIIDGDALDLELDSDSETILDASLKAGADLPFACKGGVCCTCKAKIIEGSVRMDVNYSLEQDEVDAGYILTCQSHPTSEKLVVSFDE
jgi:ring-1,2-phenylacetyl-CoA epoxidase subunit PaaE